MNLKIIKPIQYLYFLFIFLFFLGLGFFWFFEKTNFSTVDYTFVQKRVLGDDTENSLYRIFDGEKYFFVTTNKPLSIKNREGVEYLGQDIFWNPQRCAQMKSFYSKDKIYFFDTVVGNPEENNGDNFVNLLHIYNLNEKTLYTYKASRYINLAEIDKRKLDGLTQEDIILDIYYRDKKNEIFKGKLDTKQLKVEFECEHSKCYTLDGGRKLENKDLYGLGYEKQNNLYDVRPYILQIRNRFTQEIILNLKEQEQIYHFVIGY